MRKLLPVLVTMVLIGAPTSADAKRRQNKTGLTSDPNKLEMILLPGDLRVKIVNAQPFCSAEGKAWYYGDECVISQGSNVGVRGADKGFVLFKFRKWTEREGTTCPRGAEFVMSRKAFRRMVRYRGTKPLRLPKAAPYKSMSKKAVLRRVKRIYKKWLKKIS